VQQPNLSEKVDRLSVIGRQCVAVICLERFCRKYRLEHPAITKFIDHVWKVTQVGPETFEEWTYGFGLIPITGQGDPLPADLVEAIPRELLNEFDRLTQCVFETSATTWFCSDTEGTKKELLKVLDVASEHDIPIPDLGFYMNPPIEHDGWGAMLTDEQLQQWRNTA
jgi:hypothetical protein